MGGCVLLLPALLRLREDIGRVLSDLKEGLPTPLPARGAVPGLELLLAPTPLPTDPLKSLLELLDDMARDVIACVLPSAGLTSRCAQTLPLHALRS